ncbi:MAG: heavy metal-associated domain-containing protein [Candidatus Micrarchaeia archaeon]
MSAPMFNGTFITKKETKDVFRNIKNRSYDELYGINNIIARIAQKRHFANVSLDDIETARKLIKPQRDSTRYREGSTSPKYELAESDGKVSVLQPERTPKNTVINLYVPKSIGSKGAAAKLATGIGLSGLFGLGTTLTVMNSVQHPMAEHTHYFGIPFTDAYIGIPAQWLNATLNISAFMAGWGTAIKLFAYSVKEYRNRYNRAHEFASALDGAITDALKIVMQNKILTATIKVGGISDERDWTKITEAVKKIKGAKVLTIDREKDLVVLQYNFGSVLEDARAAIKNMGYKLET